LAFYLYANARWNQGRDGECAALYQEMLAAINPSQRAYSVVMREMVRGLLQLTAGNYTDAAETFYGASTHPKAMPSLVHHSQTMLAHTYYLQGKDGQALELFTAVLAVYAAEQTPGAIRIMGPRLVEPLLALAVTGHRHADFARGILAVITPNHPALAAAPVPPPQAIPAKSFRIPDTGEILTEREIEVLRLIARGADNATIATEMIVSIHTVKTHVAHVLGKLGVSSRTAAAIKARELGLAK
jgi:ATP/maltotriose-dependent transcriptional regulator MalT